MALRFRKSITLFPGVKINLSRSGPSLSVGVPGIRRTYHTDGRVTTSVGIPGTGLSWTETTRGNRTNATAASSNSRASIAPQERIDLVDDMDAFDMVSDGAPQCVVRESIQEEVNNVSNSTDTEFQEKVVKEKQFLQRNDIKNIYVTNDDEIEWTEIVSGADADELLMDADLWKYCHGVAHKIVSGDIDTYLDVIEELRPIDDLLYYGSDFEFGTDKSSYMEVEFKAKPEVLPNGMNDPLFEEFICAVCIRIAKDLMATLPVSKVIVHATVGERTILSTLFEKNKLHKLNYNNMSAKEIIEWLKN